MAYATILWRLRIHESRMVTESFLAFGVVFGSLAGLFSGWYLAKRSGALPAWKRHAGIVPMIGGGIIARMALGLGNGMNTEV